MSLSKKIMFPVGYDKVEKYKEGTLLVSDVRESTRKIIKAINDDDDFDILKIIDEEMGDKLT